jgi:hypothetical protein
MTERIPNDREPVQPKFIPVLMAAAGILLCGSLLADVPENERHEVEHLIDFVEGSDCLFRRNGKDYAGDKAIEHINQKYNYFSKKINTAEEFIELSATRSTMSGRLYTVSCADGATINSEDWLLDELERYRENSTEG